MTLRMSIYGTLVNRVPEIREKYHMVRDTQTASWQRPIAWLYLASLNAGWLLGKRQARQTGGRDLQTAKLLSAAAPESVSSVRETPERLARRLMEYDVISFDVFDTLLFRPFSRPEDLFYIVGQKLDYLDFRRIRMEAEAREREEHRRRSGSGEISLSDIYQRLEREAGIPAGEGMRTEEETERALCFANPYLLEVFRILRQKGKRLIALSDMYLPEKTVRSMLEKCGFSGMEDCFVSCEYGCSKSDGGLYERVKKKLGAGNCIHIGDNRISDGENAGKAGWDSLLYQNVNTAGLSFRASEMSAVAGSVYRGLANAHLRNGLKARSRDYECGFLYGGILALGYCQFIHEYTIAHGIGRILFLARDGDILSRVYRLLYPEEAGKVRYVLWSRLAAVKLSARYYKYDYFRRFLFHKVNQGFPLEQIFQAMELSDMLDGLTRQENSGRQDTALKKTELLTDGNVRRVQEYLLDHWEEVLAHYDSQLEIGKRYYEQALSGAKKAAVVDIGWAGSGAMALDVLFRRVWRFDCQVTGILAGTNTCHNAEPDMSEAQLASGKLVSYVFSQAHNRDLWERHDPARGDNVAMEKLFSSPFPGFRGFSGPDWEERSIRPDTDSRARQAAQIQEGILDFCRLYLESGVGKYLPRISGRDAAAPARLWMEAERKNMGKEDIQCVLA
ncbi:MAG TPA: HAD-IA family hydrolase [Candidatus Eisenbergiella stercorigallinarum]|uniref:HAD-IA family hydrolase n=1 Tax=Candidatus Eisenbergiella stercorigallinarum TaxID=2838557 RepID=A0A9D2QX46_9FIRM|nr:HAD-IA family hydrolase [Candidatus Eisenbergiella stercorigallinarum]